MWGFGEDWLAWRLQLWVPLVLSLSVHEAAHAWAAFRLGDDTAARQGRLTLNPLEHLDPIGTVVLPLLGVPFGWAKPVPIQPARFHSGVSLRMGLVLTAAAGPVSNLVLALVGVVLLLLLGASGAVQPALSQILHLFVVLNVLLAAFNLLPFPPLDGSRVVDGLIPDGWRPGWNALARVGPLGLLAFIALPLVLGVNPLGALFEAASAWASAAEALGAGTTG
jgi:Zn-dependent protease